MTTTTYVDDNLHHVQVTGRAVTACLHLVNATPSHWHMTEFQPKRALSNSNPNG